MRVDRIAERQILKAEAEGQFRDLKGAGKPLGTNGDASADAAGYRIMAEAGALPPEVSLKKSLDVARAALSRETAPEARRALQVRVADLEMRHAIACEARRAFMR